MVIATTQDFSHHNYVRRSIQNGGEIHFSVNAHTGKEARQIFLAPSVAVVGVPRDVFIMDSPGIPHVAVRVGRHRSLPTKTAGVTALRVTMPLPPVDKIF